MADISLVPGLASERNEPLAHASERASARSLSQHSSAATPRPSDRPSDRVDISDRARFLSKLASLPDIRAELVGRIRDQIASGKYETDARLDQAIANLAEDLEIQG